MKLTTFDKFPSPALTLDGGQVTSTAVDTKDIRSRHYKKTINLLLFFFALVTSCSLPRHRFQQQISLHLRCRGESQCKNRI